MKNETQVEKGGEKERMGKIVVRTKGGVVGCLVVIKLGGVRQKKRGVNWWESIGQQDYVVC